ncbi:MAG: (2Fe-2S)-binding protein [Dehalococcoidales bacterium]|jgi:aerobic-type carbon monoxide dehydrogenase small subunit (CoxS/CutS family)|nr:(2Fe-2S)-binding protein [Dehalococcoidales bacterium]MDX9986857.1 (2Fe-2S)-binding protein [Dehalococcoidales bacterium]
MPEEEKVIQDGQISRRQFIKNAGIVVGGTAVGSTILLSGCGNGETVTKTITTTVAGGTVTKYACPYDSQEFDTLAALKTHLESQHGEGGGGLEGLITLNVNGTNYILKVEPQWTLAYTLREKCLLPGTKVPCWRGECGACTVIMNGRTVYSCLVLAIEADGAVIRTVEGLKVNGELSALQRSFIKNRGFQCGMCTPGFLMTGVALLEKNPNPLLEEVAEAVSGHICACGNMNRNIQSIYEGGS